MRSIICGLGSVAIAGFLCGQSPTLREQVAKHNADVLETVIVDFPAIVLETLLKDTDIIVGGTVGDAVARLSDDERSISTTYEITRPLVWFSSKRVAKINPGEIPRVLSVTMPGGTVPIGQFAATVNYVGLPVLRRGIEVVALLNDQAGQYRLAGGLGAFVVRDGRIVAPSEDGELKRFEGASPDDFVREIVSLRKRL